LTPTSFVPWQHYIEAASSSFHAFYIDLSKMLRHILYDYQQPYVNLKEEIEFLRNYIALMMIRLPANVDIKRECNIPDPCKIYVAPMIFISLLENAFKHGISANKPSFIHISITEDNGKIVFLCENSNYPKNDTDKSGKGIGLENMYRRLELIYPERYHIEQQITAEVYHLKIIIKP